MKYYAVGFFTCIVTTFATADSLNTGSNDYYMTPPASYSTIPTSQISSPQEQCWYEQVPISGVSQEDNTPNVGGAIVGGIIGGIVGHQFGSGNAAATIAGAAIGTSLGADSGKTENTPQYQLIRKCNTVR
jgi:uncharacterized protein YcfJ